MYTSLCGVALCVYVVKIKFGKFVFLKFNQIIKLTSGVKQFYYNKIWRERMQLNFEIIMKAYNDDLCWIIF